MQRKNISTVLIAVGALLVVMTGVWLATATSASAQCGSQASSCKNCHEVQGQKPVNNDGTAWHQSHAFGDFCYICHAGNNQAKDETEAHSGMVSPLSDVKASCVQCHPNDYQERAQVYANTLGVEIGSGAAQANTATAVDASTVSSQPVVSAPAATELYVDDPNLVDYEQRYNEIVLGKKPINWGNIILIGLIALVGIGGSGFVAAREKLIKISFGDTEKIEGEYPVDVVNMLPSIKGLKPKSRQVLKNLLHNPKKAEKVLGLINAVISEDKSEEKP